MVRTFIRVLPASQLVRFLSIVTWFVVAAALHGGALGLVGITVAAWLGAEISVVHAMVSLAAALIIFVVAQWTAQMVAFRAGGPIFRALHERLGEHLVELPLGWFDPGAQTRAINSATYGVPQLMSYPALLLRPVITAVVAPVSAAMTLLVLDWRYTVAVLLGATAAWFVSRFSSRLAHVVDVSRHRVGAEATDRLLEYALRQPLIRTDQRRDSSGDLAKALADVHRTSLRTSGTVIPGLLLFSLTLNVLFATLVTIGVLWMTGGTLTVPVFVGVLVVVARLNAVASAGAELSAGLRLQRGELDRLADILDAEPLPKNLAVDHNPDRAVVSTEFIRVEGVTFAYDDQLALENIDFVLPRRGLTALVGPSGSGKTTVARLLARFWDPDAGSILLEGADLRTLTSDELYSQIAVVLQDDYFVDTTIAECIRMGRPDATADDLDRVVREAGLLDTVAVLPEGLETSVGPNGSKLSGGQRQRIAVARALLKSAPFTIMDEATSALDPEHARIVTDAASRLAKTGSVFVIAHNLDTVVRADTILVLDRGRLIQQGTHRDLVVMPGPYSELFRAHEGIAGFDAET